jgi:macrolide transport system ATP-binding/permease protein
MPLMRRIANLFKRSRVDREIRRELDAHIEMRQEDNRARGMSAHEARRDALVRFGNPVSMRERTTEADAALWLESLWGDVRYARRQLWKNPGFALTAIVVLALGMGASVAIFAFVDAALIKPLAYVEPARLVSLYETVPSCLLCNVSYQNFRDWQRSARSFKSIDIWGYARYAVHAAGGI